MARTDIPPLTAVRVAEAAARHGNFTAAANELGMTQAAVSYQIKILEERVGAQLFERHARGVSLTTIGRSLTSKATEALDILADAYADAKGSSQGTLAVSVIPTFGTNFLAQRLGKFQIESPDIAVRVEVSEGLVDFMSDGFDVAIRGGKGNWEGLKSRLLLPTVFTPMLSPDLAASIGGVKEPADLLKLPILSGHDPWWHRWFEDVNVDYSPPPEGSGGQFGPQILEANAAIAGQGVAMLTPAFFQSELERRQLVQPFEMTCDDGSGYWIVFPESRRNSGKIRKFEKWLRNEAAAFRKS
ncbi:LysR substrate-binding domain-containing protein [uncultured Roseobacter sp.]|uniref:LysR substrate-binding domain-containing protein n=1 Tax=uncultured Roseobacter sp. TaxID=114847 RepID=UPI00261302E9|nr:LysR substrate-binding domain-containing protein [uncultured Roseobacter sp.]